jgi:hypothetical protein
VPRPVGWFNLLATCDAGQRAPARIHVLTRRVHRQDDRPGVALVIAPVAPKPRLSPDVELERQLGDCSFGLVAEGRVFFAAQGDLSVRRLSYSTGPVIRWVRYLQSSPRFSRVLRNTFDKFHGARAGRAGSQKI